MSKRKGERIKGYIIIEMSSYEVTNKGCKNVAFADCNSHSYPIKHLIIATLGLYGTLEHSKGG